MEAEAQPSPATGDNTEKIPSTPEQPISAATVDTGVTEAKEATPGAIGNREESAAGKGVTGQSSASDVKAFPPLSQESGGKTPSIQEPETVEPKEQLSPLPEENSIQVVNEGKEIPTPMTVPESGNSSSPVTEENRKPTQQVKKPSYKSIVQSKSALSKHDLNIQVIDGAFTVEIPDEIIEDSTPLWEDFLIGKFLEKAPHVGKVHVIVNKIWSLGDKSIKIDAFPVNETMIKFRIKDSSTRERVLRRGMWNIAAIPMIVSKWSPVIEEAQPEMESIPLWVTLTNVPHQMYSEPGLSFIASAVGEPKRLHPDTILCNNFEEAKVFVEADLTRELPEVFHLKSKLGVDAWVEFTYPWLPPKCSKCGKWGHLKESCLRKKGSTLPRVAATNVSSATTIQQNPKDTAEVPEAVVEQNSVVAVEEQEICVDSCVVVNTTTSAPVVENTVCVVDTTSTPTKESTSASAQLVSVPAHVIEPNQVKLVVPADSSAPQRKVEKITRASVLAMVIPKRNVTSAIPAEPARGSIKEASTSQLIPSSPVTIASLRNNKFAYLDSSEDGSEDDESEEEGEDPPPTAPDMVFFSPSGKRFLRERPVPQTIKAKEMQYVARGRGNRGRGKRGGRC